jgi:predicted amino acid racemase
VPEHSIAEMLRWDPQVVTVFSFEKAKSLSRHANAMGRIQRILLRVSARGDSVFPGQEGGIAIDDVASVARRVQHELPGVLIEGITSFPCLEFDVATRTYRPTGNLGTLREARRLLEEIGIPVRQVNAPGATCIAALQVLRENGATHGEPGHALTGSTPLHALDPNQPETPAMVYVSEVSHRLVDGRLAVYGGGFYRRGHVTSGLVAAGDRRIRLGVAALDPTHIDYYRLLDAPEKPGDVRVGDTVVFAFRSQVFVTNSQVAVVSTSGGDVELLGIYDALGGALQP